MAEAVTAETVVLTGSGLLVRPYRDGDAPALFAAVRESVDTIGRWLPWCTPEYGERDAEDWIGICAAGWRSGDHYSFAVFDERGGFLGGCGLNQRNRLHNYMNIGYWVRASRQRQGVASRAAALVARFGLEQLGFNRIEIVIEPDNVASRRVAERIVARLEGIARNRIVTRAGPADAAMYALVPERG